MNLGPASSCVVVSPNRIEREEERKRERDRGKKKGKRGILREEKGETTFFFFFCTENG